MSQHDPAHPGPGNPSGHEPSNAGPGHGKKQETPTEPKPGSDGSTNTPGGQAGTRG